MNILNNISRHSYRLTSILSLLFCLTSFNLMSAVVYAQSSSAREKLVDKSDGDRIAVLSLRNRIKMSKEEVDYLTGLVRQIISKRLSRSYLIMTQENIEVLLPPNTNLDDCVSECQVETGRTIGARYIITGDVLRFGSSLRLTLRMHDTRSGRLVASEVAKANKLDDLEAPTEKAVEALINQIDGVKSNTSNTSSEPKRASTNSGRDDFSKDLDDQPKRLTRRQRLLRRARAAEAERKRRQDERAHAAEVKRKRKQNEQAEARRKRRRRRKTRRDNKSARSQTSQTKSVKRIDSEVSFGLAGGNCTNTEDFQLCDQLNNDLSFDLALAFTIIHPEDPDFGWTLSADLRYAHSNFSNSEITYGMNTLTVGALTGLKLWDIYLRALVGFGASFGRINAQSIDSGSVIELDFESERHFILS